MFFELVRKSINFGRKSDIIIFMFQCLDVYSVISSIVVRHLEDEPKARDVIL